MSLPVQSVTRTLFFLGAFAVLPTSLPAQVPEDASLRIIEPAEWTASGDERGVKVVRRGSIFIRGIANHPEGIKRIFLQGKEAYLSQNVDGSFNFTGFVEVSPGVQPVLLEVVTGNGERFEETFEYHGMLETTESPDQAWALATEGYRGKRWAVVVGISDYEDEEIDDLEFAHRDAQAFYEFLMSPNAGGGGFDEDKVLLLANEDATYRNVRHALFTFLRRPTEDDVVYVFFAGHGVTDPLIPSDHYLLTHDSEMADLPATALPMRDLSDALSRTRAKSKILITDACHSAGAGMAGTRAGTDANQINTAFLERVANASAGTVMITSSEVSQLSREGTQWGGGHGVFTYYLLQGLRGAADENNDRMVSLGEAYEHLRDRVRRSTQNSQVPTISQTQFDRFWPMSIVHGEEPTSPEQSKPSPDPLEAGSTSTVMLGLLSENWVVPDSMVAVVGIPDTVTVRLGNRLGDLVPGRLLSWRTSDEEILAVNGEGVIEPRSPGLASVSVYRYDREFEVKVRVYERPSRVAFSPPQSELVVERGDEISLTGVLELPTGKGVRLIPSFELDDTLVLSPRGSGRFLALRTGEATISANLAGYSHSWSFRVLSPSLDLLLPRHVIALGDTVVPQARYVRRDGSVQAEALTVTLESTDTAVVGVTVSGFVGRNVGAADVIASSGTSSDRERVFVLGDLLLTIRRGNRIGIESLTIPTRSLAPIISEAEEPVLSPDGSWIAFIRGGERGQPRVHVMRPNGKEVRQLTEEKEGWFGKLSTHFEAHPVWSAGSDSIFFTSNREGSYDIFAVPLEGGMPSRITRSRETDRHPDVSVEEARLLVERARGVTDSDVLIMTADGRESQNLTEDRYSGIEGRAVAERRPAFVPGSSMIVMADYLEREEGERLVLFDYTTRNTVRTLVQAQRNTEILYGVSADGRHVAYHLRKIQGESDPRIVIIDLMGTVLATIPLPRTLGIESVAWGGRRTHLLGRGDNR